MVLLSRKYGFYKEVPLLTGLKEEQNVSTNKENSVVKHTVKDSVFTNLFKEKKYLVQLYQALHPEGSVTEDDIKEVTVSNVLVDDIYNDIGFMVGSTLLVLVECQAAWTVNIIFRALMYLVQTYREYFKKTKQNLYKSKKLRMPKPELYDEQEILKSYVESERFEAENATKRKMAVEMLRENEPIDKIIRYSGLSEETVLKLQREQLQMA